MLLPTLVVDVALVSDLVDAFMSGPEWMLGVIVGRQNPPITETVLIHQRQ